MQDLIIRQLDKALKKISNLMSYPIPKTGWITTIRQALGMTTKQFGKRLGISQQAAATLAKREIDETITLKSLSNAAKALNCRLVYYFLPEESLEMIIDKEIDKKVKESISYISHSMKLEDQEVEEEEKKFQLDKLKQELRGSRSNRIWEQK